MRDATPSYARFGFPDDDHIEDLRSIIAERFDDHELPIVFLTNIRQYVPGRLALDLPKWRRTTRILAQAELAAIEVTMLRDKGQPDPPLPDFLAAANAPAISTDTVENLFAGYRSELQREDKGRNAASRWTPIVDSLVKFMGHSFAARITRRDAVRWKDHLLES